MFYEFIRKDRNGFGGGVVFYVFSKLYVVECRYLCNINLELICFKIYLENKKFIVGVIYRLLSLSLSIRDNFYYV